MSFGALATQVKLCQRLSFPRALAAGDEIGFAATGTLYAAALMLAIVLNWRADL